ncbi:MAG: sensor histidine kinase [Bacteroidota bacterium]
MKRFLNRLTGGEEKEIDHRVFLFTSIALTIFAFQAGIFNYLLDLHYMTVLLSFAGGIISLVIYRKSIREDRLDQKNYILYVIFVFLILVPLYFYNGGSYGTILYLIIALLNALMIIGRLRQIVTVFLMLTSVILLMLVMELYFPHMVVAYVSESQRMSDLVTVMIYSLSFTAYIIWMFKQKHFEDRKQIIRQKSELESAYGEIIQKNEKIEALMLEMHHRIKNNLQLASGLLSLQINRLEEGDPQKALVESRNRMDVIAMLHQQLSFREEETSININEFIRKICNSIEQAYQVKADMISLSVELEEEMIDFEKANSIGLIINEFITNSLKYARPANGQLEMDIRLTNPPGNKEVLILEYKDNGPEKIRLEENSSSLGIKLIHTLARQLSSTFVLEEEQNLFTLEIPLK